MLPEQVLHPSSVFLARSLLLLFGADLVLFFDFRLALDGVLILLALANHTVRFLFALLLPALFLERAVGGLHLLLVGQSGLEQLISQRHVIVICRPGQVVSLVPRWMKTTSSLQEKRPARLRKAMVRRKGAHHRSLPPATLRGWVGTR